MPPDFFIRRCTVADLCQILALQEEVFAALPTPELLRRNTPDMLRACLFAPHVTAGAFIGETLCGMSILYWPQTPGERLSDRLVGVDTGHNRDANYKLCLVRPDCRGHGLQRTLARELERQAVRRGIGLLCATVSPQNPYSLRNIEQLGYTFNSTCTLYGYPRCLYYKFL